MPAFARYPHITFSVFIVWALLGVNLQSSPLQTSTLQTSQAQEAKVDFWVERLRQVQPAVRVSAARQLAELGPSAGSAAPLLKECLNDPSIDVRVVAAYALAKVTLDQESSIKAIQPLLADPSEHVRYSAQWSIAYLAGQISVQQSENDRTKIIKLLEESLQLISSHEHQPRHRQVIESAIDLLRTQTVQTPVVQPIQEEPPVPATPAISAEDLVLGMYEPNDAISRMEIIGRLRDHEKFPSDLRKNVLVLEAAQLETSLLDYAIATWTETIQTDLIELLGDIAQDEILPDYSHFLIEKIVPGDQSSLERMQKIANDDRQPIECRIAAVKSVSLSRHNTSACALWLTNLLEDVDLQMFAADAIAEMGPKARGSEPKLIAALTRYDDESFQMAGLRALHAIAGDSTIAAQFIVQQLSEIYPESELVPYLLDSCSQFGESTAQAIPWMHRYLRDPRAKVRQKAATALQRFGIQAAPALPELLGIVLASNEEVFVKVAAARAIGTTGEMGSSTLLKSLAEITDPSTKIDLLRALSVSGINTAEAQTICLALIGNASLPIELRVAAANSLGAMGPAARQVVPRLLLFCQNNDAPSLHAVCLIAAAKIDPVASMQHARLGLESGSTLVRANAAFSAHLCGDSRTAFDTLLSMLNESESDQVILQALHEMGNSIADWLHEEAENGRLDDFQRLHCCRLACDTDKPDWRRLLKLVEEPQLGQEFAEILSYYWHPEVACNIGDHLDAVDVLLELAKSGEMSIAGRARLVYLLSPDGLGAAGDEEGWGGLSLTQPESLDTLQQADNAEQVAAAMASEMSGPVLSPAKKQDPEFLPSLTTDHLRVRESATVAESPDRKIEVFYGTNRQRESIGSVMKSIIAAILVVTLGCSLALTYCAVSFFGKGRRIMSLASVLALATFGSFGIFAAKQLGQNPMEAKVGYNHRMSNSIEYGRCTVSIPPNHQPGMVESPMLLNAQLIVDPNKHIVLEKVNQLSHDDFLASLKLAQSRKGKNLLVFIHGYNVSFDDAARRTAQMHFDLDFPGASVFYSWPSQADWYGYKTDQRQIEMSVGHIRGFLEDLAYKSGADTINLVAHSMGNVGLTAALQEISSPKESPLFNQVILAAPDVDAEVFKRDIAPNIVAKAKRMTLYTSKTDLALIASKIFNQGSRLGDSGSEIVTFPGIETIDATTVDSSLLGHSYYGSNVSVLTDVGHLLRNEPITGRSYLRQVVEGESNYWTFDPVLISRSQNLLDGILKK